MERLLVTTDINEAQRIIEGFSSEEIIKNRREPRNARKPRNGYFSLDVASADIFDKRIPFRPMTIITLTKEFRAKEIALKMVREGLYAAIEDEEGDITTYIPKDAREREEILIQSLYKTLVTEFGEQNVRAQNNLWMYSNNPNRIQDFGI